MTNRSGILKGILAGLLIAAAALALAWVTGVRPTFRAREGTSVIMDFAPVQLEDQALGNQRGEDQLDPVQPAARNLIILIGDGMGFGQVLGARAALVGIDGRLRMERLPVTGWVTTYSTNRMLTDSAAAATALATGFKTEMLHIAMTPEGRPVRTLLEAAASRGQAVGLLTDSYLWDATPASFAAHVSDRRQYADIADQMADSGFDLLLGEERRGLDGDDPGGEMLTAFEERGYSLARDADALASALEGQAPVLGLFAAGSLHQPDRAPNLVDLTSQALGRLARHPEGFALMIETEETDTASHGNDFERMVLGMSALDGAVRLAVDFARRDGATLVLVTADHDTGGLSLRGGMEGEPLRVSWATVGHTGNPVPLFAYGPGSHRLGGVRDNTEVARILADILGLDLDLDLP